MRERNPSEILNLYFAKILHLLLHGCMNTIIINDNQFGRISFEKNKFNDLRHLHFEKLVGYKRKIVTVTGILDTSKSSWGERSLNDSWTANMYCDHKCSCRDLHVLSLIAPTYERARRAKKIVIIVTTFSYCNSSMIAHFFSRPNVVRNSCP